MRSFYEYNPVSVAIYFIAAAGIPMLCVNPIITAISLVGALSFFFIRNGGKNMSSNIAFFVLFIITALINPIFSHNGATVLFVVNDSPITLEAVIYGITAAAMIISVLYWFRSFTAIMTSDKLLYLFGGLSPRVSLVLSMALRFVPLFSRQQKKIRQTQTAMGLYKDGNIVDKVRGEIRVFSVMVTWALENGIITADSMTARGYGIQKRTHFSVFKMRRSDVFLLCASVVLLAVICVCAALGALDCSFYPVIYVARTSPLSVIGYTAYTLLVLLPTFAEAEEKLKWKYLKSKI